MTPMNLTCPVCQAQVEPRLQERKGPFTLYLCPLCEVIFAHPLRNPGSSWYEEDVETRVRLLVASARKPEEMLREPHHRFLRDRPAAGGALLDVGCAEGGFLAVAQRHYRVAGLDFNPQAIALARERFGLQHTYVMTLEEFRQARAEMGFAAGFDVITAFDVLEHVDAPRPFLAMVRELLAPGGWLAINEPNRDRRPNLREPWDYPPHHLTRWNKRSLANFLEGNGFSVAKMEEFTDRGYLAIDWMDRLPPVRALKRTLAAAGAPANGNGHLRAGLPSLLGRARLSLARVLDWPLLTALGAVKAPGQMLYCLARREESGGRQGAEKRGVQRPVLSSAEGGEAPAPVLSPSLEGSKGRRPGGVPQIQSSTLGRGTGNHRLAFQEPVRRRSRCRTGAASG